ncbi:Protein of unknown function [Pyronema omphalodes CBS 100304]|uniref:Uncharacterized protein n=1 Tax=Pyronema omphalodes (strain CBS 100304) TaxID=1076935 RepID=U4LS16_PYROM|nr:Protein of unknown function [Pyronema omphalodes CBS 100304]
MRRIKEIAYIILAPVLFTIFKGLRLDVKNMAVATMAVESESSRSLDSELHLPHAICPKYRELFVKADKAGAHG